MISGRVKRPTRKIKLNKEGRTMPTSQRVVFSFDESSLDALNNVKERGGFPSLGMAVRESIQLSDFLQGQVDKGFSEIVVRNPETNQEKTIVVSSLQKLADKKAKAAGTDK